MALLRAALTLEGAARPGYMNCGGADCTLVSPEVILDSMLVLFAAPRLLVRPSLLLRALPELSLQYPRLIPDRLAAASSQRPIGQWENCMIEVPAGGNQGR